MKKIVMLGFVMAFLALVQTTNAQIINGDPCAHLIAGQWTNVGEVCVSNDLTHLTVRYETISAWWALQETHLHVWDPLVDDGPKVTGGGPSPGQFPFTVPDFNDTVWAEYVIPLDGTYPGKGKKTGEDYDWTIPGTILNIAAHGVAGICDCDDLGDVLPESVTAVVFYPGTDAYFDVTISGDGVLDGTHKGWCADLEDPIEGDDTPFLGDLYSTICADVLDIPDDLIVYDSNLPLVNWVLNNRDGYTAGDVQYAIWHLLSGQFGTHDPAVEQAALDSIDSEGPHGWPVPQDYDPVKGLELAEAAEANGAGFWPACGEVMAVVFVPPAFEEDNRLGEPVGAPRQTVLFEVPAPCCETVWGGVPVIRDSDGDGYGMEFPGKNWALYFKYVVQAVTVTP